MRVKLFDRELKKGSAELLILSLIEHRPRHGYEISKLIEQRSEGVLKFNVASFYPLLYRLEKRGFISGRWVEKAGQRRRRYYQLTAQGQDSAEGAARARGPNLSTRSIESREKNMPDWPEGHSRRDRQAEHRSGAGSRLVEELSQHLSDRYQRIARLMASRMQRLADCFETN
jgi:PadR family transcriptional regulator PadR